MMIAVLQSIDEVYIFALREGWLLWEWQLNVVQVVEV